jgi:anti-sigma B factor antagonist
MDRSSRDALVLISTVTGEMDFQTNAGGLSEAHASSQISRLGSSVQSDFRVEMLNQGRTVIIAVSGELDLASGPELEAELNQVSGPETQMLVVDLRGLEFMDSTGLSILVRAHQRLSEEGCEMGLVKGSSQVQRLLDLTGVSDRLTLVDEPEELLHHH